MRSILLIRQRGGLPRPESPAQEPDEPRLIAGVGSSSNSYSIYPPTGPITSGDYYVAPGGSNSNSGTSTESPFATIQHALNQVQGGGTILVRGGVHYLSSTLSFSGNSPIRLLNYGNERPILDGSGLGSGSRMFSVNGQGHHIKGFEMRNIAGGPILSSGKFNTFEDLVIHHACYVGDPGGAVYFFGASATDNLCLDLVVLALGDGSSQHTNTADCYRSTGGAGNLAARNHFVRCLGFNAPDDTFDLYYGTSSELIDCGAAGGGWYWNGNRAADGGGFKLGSGAAGVGNHLIRGSFAGYCYNDGFGHNSAADKLTFINNTAYGNGDVGMDAGNRSGTVVQSTLSLLNGTNQAGVSGSGNSWNTGVTAGNVHFADPANGDFSLMPGSAAISAGVGGAPQGASDVALELLMRWWNHSLVYIPGRGPGPGGTGLPADS